MDATSVVSPIPAPPAISTEAPPRRQRLWPAALALYFLAPGVGEVISGSTPPLLFLQPFGFLFTPLLYGSSAILIHEIVVHRHLSWGNVLLLGAAFGIFQEALVVQTWFTYLARGSASYSVGAYGALWGVNWLWAVELSLYHAFISIAVPLILLNTFFPRRSQLPWLGRKSTIALLAWLLIPCGLLAIGVATTQFAKVGYTGPLLVSYLACVAILLIVLALGVFLRFPAPQPDFMRHAPSLWKIRWSVFGLLILSFAMMVILPATKLPAIVVGAVELAIFAYGLWRIRSWSARVGWDQRHMFAIATGLVMYFALAWAPLVEFPLHLPARIGLTAFDLVVLLAVALYARRLNRRVVGASGGCPPPRLTAPSRCGGKGVGG